MKKLLAVLVGFVLAAVIAYAKGADPTSALVVGLFYTVPILFALVLPPWGPAAMAVVVLVAMLLAGPSVPRDQQDQVIGSWAFLWVWIAIAVAITVAWTWFEQRRKRSKTTS